MALIPRTVTAAPPSRRGAGEEIERRWGGAATVLFGVALLVYAAVALWLTRGATFTIDELTWIGDVDGFEPGSLIEPHNGHAIVLARTVYAVSAEFFGLDPLVVRVAMVIAVAAAAAALFAFVARRLGRVTALPIALVVLFFGSSTVPVDPNVAVFAQSTAFGIGALLALEAPGGARLGLACLLLVLSLFSLSLGVAFLAAAAVLLLCRADRFRSAWVVAVPAVLFAIWWIWAQGQPDTGDGTADLLTAPAAAATTLAAGIGALAGLGHEVDQAAGEPLETDWGSVLAILAIVALAWRVRRVGGSPMLLALVAGLLVVTIGVSVAAADFRPPDSTRYAYATGVFVVMIGAEAFRGARPSLPILAGIAGLAAFALAGNLADMRNRGNEIRADSDRIRAQLVGIELQGERLDPGLYDILLPVEVGPYLAAVERYGSPALDREEVLADPAVAGRRVDAILGGIIDPRLEAAPGVDPKGCALLRPGGGEADVAGAGVLLTASESASLALRRFGDAPSVELGEIPRGGSASLAVPGDEDPTPWRVGVTAGGPVRVCSAS